MQINVFLKMDIYGKPSVRFILEIITPDQRGSVYENSLLQDRHFKREFQVKDLKEEVDAQKSIDQIIIDHQVKTDERFIILEMNKYLWFE